MISSTVTKPSPLGSATGQLESDAVSNEMLTMVTNSSTVTSKSPLQSPTHCAALVCAASVKAAAAIQTTPRWHRSSVALPPVLIVSSSVTFQAPKMPASGSCRYDSCDWADPCHRRGGFCNVSLHPDPPPFAIAAHGGGDLARGAAGHSSSAR